ncbi:MAG: hypothetical protein KIC46_04955 [Clostridiales bacterium]|nr:hypothetical protein [Clostridiales bacterium]
MTGEKIMEAMEEARRKVNSLVSRGQITPACAEEYLQMITAEKLRDYGVTERTVQAYHETARTPA